MGATTPPAPRALAEPGKWRRSVESLTAEQLERLREALRRSMAIKKDDHGCGVS